VIFLKYWSPTV